MVGSAENLESRHFYKTLINLTFFMKNRNILLILALVLIGNLSAWAQAPTVPHTVFLQTVAPSDIISGCTGVVLKINNPASQTVIPSSRVTYKWYLGSTASGTVISTGTVALVNFTGGPTPVTVVSSRINYPAVTTTLFPPITFSALTTAFSGSFTNLCPNVQTITITMTTNRCLTNVVWSAPPASNQFALTSQSSPNGATYSATYTRKPFANGGTNFPVSVTFLPFGATQSVSIPKQVTFNNTLPCAVDQRDPIRETGRISNNNTSIALEGLSQFGEIADGVVITTTTATKTANIYPNPVSSTLTIDNLEAVNSVRIMDMTGKVVAQQTFESVTEMAWRVDVSGYANGTYLVQTIGKNGLVNNSKVQVMH
jgi:hypothetical protein